MSGNGRGGALEISQWGRFGGKRKLKTQKYLKNLQIGICDI
jgi:hypothetical protein